jgi:hypothetical protein
MFAFRTYFKTISIDLWPVVRMIRDSEQPARLSLLRISTAGRSSQAEVYGALLIDLASVALTIIPTHTLYLETDVIDPKGPTRGYATSCLGGINGRSYSRTPSADLPQHYTTQADPMVSSFVTIWQYLVSRSCENSGPGRWRLVVLGGSGDCCGFGLRVRRINLLAGPNDKLYFGNTLNGNT